MNKRKKVAWHKHLAKAKKLDERRKAQKVSAASVSTPATPARR